MAGVLAGGRLEDCAAAIGPTLRAFYSARERDPQFRAAWEEARAASAEAERRPRRGGRSGRLGLRGKRGGEVRIAANNRRRLQKRKMRHVRLCATRRQIFLAHFAWSCDAAAAAREAGVCERTVYNHRRADSGFAAEFDVALEQGYVRLEAEAVRQRLAAQQRLRAAIEGADPGAIVSGDAAAEFERVLKLLARCDRRRRRPESRSDGPRRTWTFDAALALLGRRLKALAVAVPPLPPEIAERYDRLPDHGGEAGEDDGGGDGEEDGGADGGERPA